MDKCRLLSGKLNRSGPINFQLMLLSFFPLLFALVAAQPGCYQWNPGTAPLTVLNPGLYYPSAMTDRVCTYQCLLIASNKAFIYGSIFQGTVCLCQQSVGTAAPASTCNASCSGASISCGSNGLTGFGNFYALPCSPSINVTAQKVVIGSSLTQITTQACCNRMNSSSNFNTTVLYDPRLGLGVLANANLSSQCSTNTFTFSFPLQGYTVSTAAVSSVSDAANMGTIVRVVQPIRVLSAIPVTIISFGMNYVMQMTVAASANTSITFSLGNGVTVSSMLPTSASFTLGSVSATSSGTVDNNIWLMPAYTATSNLALVDVRMRLNSSSCAAGTTTVVYLQIYRPSCASGNVYCYLSNSCVPKSACSVFSSRNRTSQCASPGMFSLSSRKCSNQVDSGLTQLEFGSYYLQYEIPIDLTTATQLTTTTREFFVSLVAQAIWLQPGDVPAFYQPNTVSCAVLIGSGNSVSIPSASINNWNTRSAGSTAATYPLISFSAGVVQVNSAPVMMLSFLKASNVTLAFVYLNSSCLGILGCYNETVFNMSVSLANTLSQHSVSNAVRVQLNITGVTFNFTSLAPSFLPIDLQVNQHYGSLPRYDINYGDSQSPVTGLLGILQQSSSQHFYTNAGTYLVTLNASNDFNSQIVQQSILIQDPIQGLFIYSNSYPVGIINQTITFVIGVTQGSNGTYDISFGDGNNSTIFFFDTVPTYTPPTYLSYFILLSNSDVLLTESYSALVSGGAEDCAKLCLTLTNASFSCVLFAFNQLSTKCRLFSTGIQLHPKYNVIQVQNSNSLYVLHNFCANDLLDTVSYNATVTSGSASIKMAQSGWTAVGGVNESLNVTFTRIVQINVLLIAAANGSSSWIQSFVLQYSRDSLNWVNYTSSTYGSVLSGPSSSSQIVSNILDPPIVTRFLRIQPVTVQGAQASARVAFSGCSSLVSTYSFTTTYSPQLFNTTSYVNVSVTGCNLVGCASSGMVFGIDVPISVTSFTCLSQLIFVYSNGSLPFRVSGVWGNYTRTIVQRQDGLILLDTTTYNSPADIEFNLTFYDPGLWTLTVTVQNFGASSSYTMTSPVMVILFVPAGCNLPYVDISVPNACYSGVNCDANFNKFNALTIQRSATLTMISNVTSWCSRPPMYTWTVERYDLGSLAFLDYSPTIYSTYAKRYSTLSTPKMNGSMLASLIFQPRVLDYGLYRINLTVTISATSPAPSKYVVLQELSAKSSTFVSIVPSPLRPCINNNAFSIPTIYDPTQNLTVNAACSTDPDMWPDEDQQLSYSWSCFRSCERSPVFDSAGNFVPWNSGNPYFTFCTGSESLEGCFRPVGIHQSGPLTPRNLSDWNSTSPANPMIANASLNQLFLKSNYWAYFTAPNNSFFTVNSWMLFYGLPHYAVLTIKKRTDSRFAQTMAAITPNQRLPPQVSVTCVANCYPASQPSPVTPSIVVDPNSYLKIASTIGNFNPFTTYYYTWSICAMRYSSTNTYTFSDIVAMLNASYTNCTDIQYDWSRASTSNNSPGFSLDKSLPIFNSSVYGRVLAILLNLKDGSTGYTSQGYILALINNPPNVSSVVVTVTPGKGTALTTPFSIYCSGARVANNPPFYSIGYTLQPPPNTANGTQNLKFASQCTWLTTMSRACTLDVASLLPAGNATDNYYIYVCIGITDGIGCSNYTYSRSVQVQPLSNVDAVLQNALNSSAILAKVYNSPPSFIAYSYAVMNTINPPSYANMNSTCGNVTCAPVFASTTAVPVSVSGSSTLLNAVVVSTLVNTMQILPNPSTLSSLSQTTTLLSYMTQNVSQVLPNTTQFTYNVASQLTDTLSTLANSTSSTNANDLDFAAGPIIQALNNALNASSLVTYNSINRNTTTPPTPFDTPIPPPDLRNQSDQYTNVMVAVGKVLLAKKVVNEQISNLVNAFGAQLVSLSKLSNCEISLDPSGCSAFIFGSAWSLLNENRTDPPSSVQLLNMQTASNQFLWLSDATNMRSTLTMDLLDSTFKMYKIRNATGPKLFEIWIDTGLQPTRIPIISAKVVAFTQPLKVNMMIHNIFVRANASLFINVQQFFNFTTITRTISVNGTRVLQNFTILQNTASYNGSNIMFIIYVQKSAKPTDRRYQANCTVPNLDPVYLSCAREMLNMTTANVSAIYRVLLDQTNMNFYRTLSQIPDRCTRFSKTLRNPWTCMLNSTQLNNPKDATFYIGVRAVKWNWTVPFVDGVYRSNITSPPSPTSDLGRRLKIPLSYVVLNYTLFAYYSGCYFYDSARDRYSSEGCVVGGCSSPYATQCFCNHLTTFSNLFQLPSISFDPNELNIDSLNASPGVMCFLVVIICLYCIVWIWARHADLQTEEKVGVIYLPENDPLDLYGYEITVWTGHMPGSGTTAHVSIIIAGDERELQPRLLHDPCSSRKAFQTGNTNRFLVTTPRWLGKLSHLRIWHDNWGRHPSWYLSRILVRDLYTGAKYYFITNSWFSAERGTGAVDKLIPVAGKQEMRSIGNVFWTRASNGVLDGHIWVSVATRPTRSRFTRVQRLTCCLVMCCSAILFNLLGYIVRTISNTQINGYAEDPDPPILSFGPIRYTAYTLTVSIIGALCSIPVNFLIVVLFHQRRMREPDTKASDPYERYLPDLTDPDVVEDLETKQRSQDFNIKKEEEDDSYFSRALDRVRSGLKGCCSKILPLPWWSHYVAYCIAFLAVVACFLCTAILAYSNLKQAWQQESWLQSIVLSLLLSIVVLQPLQIVAIVLIFAFIVKLPYEDEDELSKEIALRRPLVIMPDTTKNVRRKSLARPPPIPAITRSIRERRKREEEIESQIMLVICYVAFLALLFATAYLQIAPSRPYEYDNLKERLRIPAPSNGTWFLDVASIWNYVNNVALPLIYLPTDVPPMAVMSDVPSYYASGGLTFIMGVQLRQQRVAASVCSVPDLLSAVVTKCNGEYSLYSADSNSYLAGWYPIPPNAYSNLTNTTPPVTPFTHQGSNSVLDAAVPSMNGDGYIATLGGNLSSSLQITADLSASNWIDARSRIIFIEFLLYNPSSGLYIVSSSEISLRPTGITYRTAVEHVLLNRYGSVNGNIYILADLLAVFFMVIFIGRLIVNLCSSSGQFYNQSWAVYDLCVAIICILTVIVQGAYVASSLYFESVIKDNPQQYINLLALTSLNYTALVFIALIVFLLNIRFIKVLSFYRRMQLICDVFRFTFGSLITQIVFVVLSLLAFTQMLHLIYFSCSQSYSSISETMQKLMQALTASVNVESVIQQSTAGLVMFILFTLFAIFGAMRLFLPLLLGGVREARLKYMLEGEEREDPLAYLVWKVKMLCGCNGLFGDDDMFEYISGLHDYEELFYDFQQRFEDLTQKTAVTVGPRAFEDAEKLSNRKETELLQSQIVSS